MGRGYSKSKIDQALDPTRDNSLSDECMSHKDQRNWLSNDPSRAHAASILENRDDGTFLIRPSRDNKYALSIK